MTQPSTAGESAEDPLSSLRTPPLSGDDLLLWSALPDLTLNIAQTAALCGVSVRQLGYWTQQGYVTAAGRGVRRLYGPDALRRILAIRQAMQNGLSLRQALRAVAGVPPLAADAAAPDVPGVTALAPADAALLASGLVSFFDRNSQTRDNAAGLATKLGRSADDVRHAAEALAAQGVLTRVVAQGETIFSRAPGRTS